MKNLLLIISITFALNTFSQTTLIPDPNFELALINQGYDTGSPDGSVPTANISSVTSLVVLSANITDLTGIQDFTALNTLVCNFNNLSSLDLSQNIQLTSLQCYSNQLTSLNILQNYALTYLDCNSNLLTNLTVTQNANLGYLNCADNLLSFLDVSQNVVLTTLFCGWNQMNTLDVSQNVDLMFLRCNINQLTNLDVSQNTNLLDLFCYNNNLTFLNVKNGNNIALTSFKADGNPDLTRITVDNVAWSTSNWTVGALEIGAQSSFSLDCNSLGINEFISNSPKQLSKIVDLTGKEIQYQKNTLMIYVYEDGSSEKVVEFE